MKLTAATHPTFYFIGVSTKQSSIMTVFPDWAAHLGLNNVEIKGIDFPLHAPKEGYRAVVQFLKNDPNSLGALVTTHKIDLYTGCADLFDVVDAHAKRLGETSCLSKKDGQFVCHAKDPITAGLTLDSFIPSGHFAKTQAEVFAIGAGGSTIALTWHLMQASRGTDRPARVVVSDRSLERLHEIDRMHKAWDSGIPCEYILAQTPQDNDAVLQRLQPGALVVNATGMGKDTPGSPITDAGLFPSAAIVWELNYRGDLLFLQQARRQARERHLQVEDGWVYFIYGWTRVIAEVFHIQVPVSGPEFQQLCRIAEHAGKPAPQ